MRLAVVAAFFAIVSTSVAHEVGIFANDRLTSYVFNLENGAYMQTVRGIWEARGVTWRQTSSLTPEFLNTVDILYISHFRGPSLTQGEQSALWSWVRGGGTLLFFGDCG